MTQLAVWGLIRFFKKAPRFHILIVLRSAFIL